MLDRQTTLEEHRNNNGGYIIIDKTLDTKNYYPLERLHKVNKYLENSVIIEKVTYNNGYIVTVI